ncbi:MAG: adenylyltransferase/cytidyltransferase family protein [Nanoarchaeota archaeon]|nr:adenylyltransferase/cytidyltransferase family protein [Nanoarchaeota archaeon]
MANIVFVSGCFNLLHPGHVYFLNKAKEFGDILVVAIADDNITKHKRVPIINHKQRKYMIKNLKCVDYVISEENEMPPENIKTIVKNLLPDIWVTIEDNPNLASYQKIARENNIEFIILERNNEGIFNISTTEIIERLSL